MSHPARSLKGLATFYLIAPFHKIGSADKHNRRRPTGRVSFGGGGGVGLKSLARIFPPLIARKSSGVCALPEYYLNFFFARKLLFEQF